MSGASAEKFMSGPSAGKDKLGMTSSIVHHAGFYSILDGHGWRLEKVKSGVSAANKCSGVSAAKDKSGVSAAKVKSGVSAAKVKSGVSAGKVKSGASPWKVNSGAFAGKDKFVHHTGYGKLIRPPSLKPAAGFYSTMDDHGWHLKEVKDKLDCSIVQFLSYAGKTRYLVRSNGDRICFDAVRGKHVLICCVSLPVTDQSRDANYCRAMIDTYTELPRDVFEIVLVVRMKSGFGHVNGKAAFSSFFSAFPCLAIPFSDSETCDHIFSSIHHDTFSPYISAIVVDPMGNISPPGVAEKLIEYGSGLYPFLENKMEHIVTQDHVLRIRLDPFYEIANRSLTNAVMGHPLLRKPLSLYKDILLSDPDFILERFNPAGGYLSVSELSNKYVGLYLCIDGEFMLHLQCIQQHCIRNNQELEIVLVCMSLFKDTDSYNEGIFKIMKRYRINSWLIYPYNSTVCRRLWRVFAQQCDFDKLIILPPNCESGELQGAAVIMELGVDKYPFTRSLILERRLAALRSLNPASWIKGTCYPALEGKKLLIYLDRLQYLNEGTLCFQLMMKHYPEIKEKGWEVVFVPLDVVDMQPSWNYYLDMMTWPIMPLSAARESSLTRQLFLHLDTFEGIIAVREDGMIVSRQAEERLMKDGVSESLFDDVLREELAFQLTFFDDNP